MIRLIFAIGFLISAAAHAGPCQEGEFIFDKGISVPAASVKIEFRPIPGAGYSVAVRDLKMQKKYSVTSEMEVFQPLRDSESGYCLPEDPGYGMTVQGTSLYLSRVFSRQGFSGSGNLIRYDLIKKERSEILISSNLINPLRLEKLGTDSLLVYYSNRNGDGSPSMALTVLPEASSSPKSFSADLHHDFWGKLAPYQMAKDPNWILYWGADNSLYSFSIPENQSFPIADPLGMDTEKMALRFALNSQSSRVLFIENSKGGQIALASADLRGEDKKLILENLAQDKYCQNGAGDSLSGLLCKALPLSSFYSCPKSTWAVAFQRGPAETLSVQATNLLNGEIREISAAQKQVAEIETLQAACTRF